LSLVPQINESTTNEALRVLTRSRCKEVREKAYECVWARILKRNCVECRRLVLDKADTTAGMVEVCERCCGELNGDDSRGALQLLIDVLSCRRGESAEVLNSLKEKGAVFGRLLGHQRREIARLTYEVVKRLPRLPECLADGVDFEAEFILAYALDDLASGRSPDAERLTASIRTAKRESMVRVRREDGCVLGCVLGCILCCVFRSLSFRLAYSWCAIIGGIIGVVASFECEVVDDKSISGIFGCIFLGTLGGSVGGTVVGTLVGALGACLRVMPGVCACVLCGLYGGLAVWVAPAWDLDELASWKWRGGETVKAAIRGATATFAALKRLTGESICGCVLGCVLCFVLRRLSVDVDDIIGSILGGIPCLIVGVVLPGLGCVILAGGRGSPKVAMAEVGIVCRGVGFIAVGILLRAVPVDIGYILCGTLSGAMTHDLVHGRF
jgi:uncharacterized membrane protein YeaQ/YmgE (transglycosylase-associated protein family)